MSSPNDPSALFPQPRDADSAFVFEAGLTELESAMLQLLRGVREHPGLTQAEFELLAAPVLADLRRAIPPPAPGWRDLPPLPHLPRLDLVLAPAPHP